MKVPIFLFILEGVLFAQTSIENRVNEHLSKTHHQIEIQKQKREAELFKENQNIKIDARQKPQNQKSFLEPRTTISNTFEADIKDHFDYNAQDPVQDAQRDISHYQQSEYQKQLEQQKFIEEFKRRAKESGVEVEVDPETLRAYPVPSSPNK